MIYKNIVVAIDLAQPSDLIIGKSLLLAKSLGANLSFIHVDISNLDADNDISAADVVLPYNDAEAMVVSGLKRKLENQLEALCESIDYPVSNTVIVLGREVESELAEAIKKMDVDLLVCGHHHGFWNHWWSSAHKLIDLTVVDLLLIRL